MIAVIFKQLKMQTYGMLTPKLPLLFKMLFFLYFLFILPSSSPVLVIAAGGNARAMFVFGDSLLDSGNNNYLNTTGRCKYFPYGIDFPLGATGRFTNGMNAADILGQFLGLPHFLPAFYDPQAKGSAILAGVNFAAGGAELLKYSTSSIPSLGEQVVNFYNVTLKDLESQLNESLPSYIQDSIFLLSFGGVDYMGYLTDLRSAALGDLISFTKLLLKNYTLQLKKLYDYGARRFVVLNLILNGCSPNFYRKNNDSCWTIMNDASLLFNKELIGTLDGLRQSLPGFIYVHVNMSGIVSTVLDDPVAYGFQVTERACCITSVSSGFCVEGYKPCPTRNTFAYFDGGHPTEKLYSLICSKAYISQMHTEVYPYNVEVLASLNISEVTDSFFSKQWSDV